MASKDKTTCPAEYTQEDYNKAAGIVSLLGFGLAMLVFFVVADSRSQTEKQAGPVPTIPMETIKPFDL